LIRITARSREGGTSRAKPGFMGHVGGCPRNAARLCHAGLKQRFGESRVGLMAYGRTPWS
jgi:hypothetical protein